MTDKDIPAFPNTGNSTWNIQPTDGMTLRDYFAAKAIQIYMKNEIWREDVYKQAARESYKVADAMLKARNG